MRPIEPRDGPPASSTAGAQSPAGISEVWVCFARPRTPTPPHVALLSFLPAHEEIRLASEHGRRVIRARDIVPDVRGDARAAYVDFVARVGVMRDASGQTIRQLLQERDLGSRWWLLKFTEKDSVWEGESLHAGLLQAFCVRRVMDRFPSARLRAIGAADDLLWMLRSMYPALTPRPSRVAATARAATALARGVAGRVRFAVATLRTWWHAPRGAAPPDHAVFLEAHWDWSVQPDSEGGLRDRYFLGLPAALRRRGIAVAWLAWNEPAAEAWQRGRRVRRVVAAAGRHPGVVFLESLLSPAEILLASASIRDLFVVGRRLLRRLPAGLPTAGGVDLSVPATLQLLGCLAGPSVARGRLVATATRRACRRSRAPLLLTFLELFLHARALYAGVPSGTAAWTLQHASYASDKLLGRVDPRLELAGDPDGLGVPRPSRIVAMGELGRRYWMASGFQDAEIDVLGGLRYEHVRLLDRPRSSGPAITLLLVTSMHAEMDLDMVGAACAAFADNRAVRLRVRSHPAYPLHERPAFRRFASCVEVSRDGLEADCAGADVALISYSSLGEELVLRGLPVWHWDWAGVQPSVFLDVPVVPVARSVGDLRVLMDALRCGGEQSPTRDVRSTLLRECFGPGPDRATEAIAERIATHLAGGGRPAPGPSRVLEPALDRMA